MHSADILHPMFCLVALTFIVLLHIPIARFRAAFAGRVTANDFRLGESAEVPDPVRLPNRNYMNLLELPVLFYVGCLALYVTGRGDAGICTLAWVYVGLRAQHSLIHLTYNNVLHRLSAFALSNFVLATLWFRFSFLCSGTPSHDGRLMSTPSNFYRRIFANNRKWVASKLDIDPDYFTKLAKGQRPEVLYIGCSDSRITAEELMGADPGDVFVHRNIANIVAPTDLSALSVIEYAIAFLHVKYVVVCGHYECGGVRAAMQPRDLGILNPWLRNVRDVYRMHLDELDDIKDEEARYRRLIELNVEEQCVNVMKTAVLQRAFLENGYPRVHGCVFDIHTGRLVDLKIDFTAKLRRIRDVYDLGVASKKSDKR